MFLIILNFTNRKTCKSHLNELIARYQPYILWNDLGFPGTAKEKSERLFALFSEYLNEYNPDGVINNRWSLPKDGYTGDFETPEYTDVAIVSETGIEMNRGLGKSFGFNRMEGEKETLTTPDLIRLFIDVVSHGRLIIIVIYKCNT